MVRDDSEAFLELLPVSNLATFRFLLRLAFASS